MHVKVEFTGMGWKRHTGRAVDSNSPQSRTRPVIRPAERRASRWLEANDMDGTWRGVSAEERSN
jgi:hypothetical protein